MKIVKGKVNIVNVGRILAICENRHTIINTTESSKGIEVHITASIVVKDLVRLGNLYIEALKSVLRIADNARVYITGINGYTATATLHNGRVAGNIDVYDTNGKLVKCKPYHIERIGSEVIISKNRIHRGLTIEKAVLKKDKFTYTIDRDEESIDLLLNGYKILEGTLTVNSNLNPAIDIIWISNDVNIDSIETIIKQFKGYENIDINR